MTQPAVLCLGGGWAEPCYWDILVHLKDHYFLLTAKQKPITYQKVKSNIIIDNKAEGKCILSSESMPMLMLSRCQPGFDAVAMQKKFHHELQNLVKGGKFFACPSSHWEPDSAPQTVWWLPESDWCPLPCCSGAGTEYWEETWIGISKKLYLDPDRLQ